MEVLRAHVPDAVAGQRSYHSAGRNPLSSPVVGSDGAGRRHTAHRITLKSGSMKGLYALCQDYSQPADARAHPCEGSNAPENCFGRD